MTSLSHEESEQQAWIAVIIISCFRFQVISIFTLVEVQLKADGAPMKYSAVLKRPEESNT